MLFLLIIIYLLERKSINMDLENVTKYYTMKDSVVNVLKDVNYSFEMGKLYVIKGHSGVGKSTLIKIMGLILNCNSGNIIIDGVNIANMGDNDLSNIRMNYLGFVFQDYNLDANLNARDNIILPMLINKKIDKNQYVSLADSLLEKMDLTNCAKHYPCELSGGEQQRVAIARSLVNDPKIILADEPTGNLDVNTENEIFKIFKELSNNGKCVIIVTHSDYVDKYADYILTLKDQKLVLVSENKSSI